MKNLQQLLSHLQVSQSIPDEGLWVNLADQHNLPQPVNSFFSRYAVDFKDLSEANIRVKGPCCSATDPSKHRFVLK